MEKMRTIALFATQFNMNNKKMGLEMMIDSERTGSIMEDNSGSRKDRNCITVALEKVLSMDTILQLKCAAAHLETDLRHNATTGCSTVQQCCA